MPQPQRRNPWDPVPGPGYEPPKKKGGLFWALAFVGAVIALVLVVVVAVPGRAAGGIDYARLIYLIVLLAAISASVGAALYADARKTVRHAAIWLAVAAGIAALFSFRHEFGIIRDRVAGNIAPTVGQVEEGGKSVTFYAREDGHFYIEAEAEGVPILFLVDTGASDVVLTRKDAERLRYEPAHLDFSRVYSTANGLVRGAPITLEGIGIGSIYVRNVEASVNEGDMGTSLLGMSFLGRLDGYEVSRDKLTLHQ